ncbi:flavin reductase family protein [Granulosicoccus antarcticus]|nr:flavin reductase family protein [Granulosicoccus antarcticus]
MPSITASAFTSALSQAANGVSVVTTAYEDMEAGLTVSSMCSVCADPALLLVCVNLDNPFCALAEQSGRFAVNILPSHCMELATVFAGLGDQPEQSRFDSGIWTTLSTGAPILTNALVALDCKVDSTLVKGSHRVFFGEVVDVRTTSGEPLLYTDRRFAVVEPVPL